MSATWFPLIHFRTPDIYAVPGRFETDGTNDPVNVFGDGFTVAYAATGLFNVSFDDYFEGVISIPFEFKNGATSLHRAALTGYTKGDSSNNATCQFTVSLLDTGAYAADDTSDGDEVHFTAIFSKRQGSG